MIISYAQFRILLMEGIYISVALILKDKPTPELKQSLSLFITRFEQKHVNKIKQWDGSLAPFRNASELLDRVINLKYQHPLIIEKYNPKSLGPLEQVLCLIAENLQERKKYFTIGDIADKTRDTRPEPSYEIMYDIDSLINKKIFKVQPKEFVEQIKAEEEALDLDSLISSMHISQDGASAVGKDKRSKKEIFIEEVGLQGITDEQLKDLMSEMEYMSYSSIDVLKSEIIFSGSDPEERIKYINKTLLKNRKKLKTIVANDIKKSEKLAEKEKFLEAYDSLNNIKENLEKLGEEVHAKLIAVQISAIIDKFDFTDEMKILRIRAAEHIKSAEKQLSSQKISEGVLFYRKAARIYLELGDIENANKFFELGDDAERTCFED